MRWASTSLINADSHAIPSTSGVTDTRRRRRAFARASANSSAARRNTIRFTATRNSPGSTGAALGTAGPDTFTGPRDHRGLGGRGQVRRSSRITRIPG